MKNLKILSTLMLICTASFGQMTSYSYTSSSGTFAAVTGGTDINSIEANDQISLVLPIGFSFNYCGINYTKFRANSNGWISLDTTITPSVSDQRTNNLSGNTSLGPVLAPLWDDLDGTTGTASYTTTGSSPNRILTVEWKNWEWNFQATSATVSFQLKLYEGTNNVEFVYRPESGSVVSGTASVGIKDTSAGSGNFISLSALANTATASKTIETTSINAKPISGQTFLFTRCNANIDQVGALCANSAPIFSNSGSGLPSGGSSAFFVNGTAQSSFDPTTLSIGNHTLMFTYATSSCTDTNKQVIRVDSVTQIQFSMPSSICSNIDTFQLNGSPIGGNYNGQGVLAGSNNLLPSSFTNPSVEIITYSFTNAFNCSDSISMFYQIDTISKSTVSVSNVLCDNTPSFNLTGGTPAGGNYFGSNVSNSMYTGGVIGADTVYYNYQASNGCADTSYAAITINSSPGLNFTDIGRFCENSGSITLNTASPSGGVYSGPGVVGTTYTPSVPGTDTIKYVILHSNSCSDSAFQYVNIDSVTATSLAGMGPFCDNATAIALNTGLPIGGVYSGNGVNGINYSPSQAGVGFDTLSYTFTNGLLCKDSSFVLVRVNPSPTVSYSGDLEFCLNDMEQQLTGAVPLNGKYNGVGVNSTSGRFDPKAAGAGTHSITYVLTNGNNCSDSASVIAQVIENPVFSLGEDIEICGDESTELDPGIDSVNYIWSSGETSRKIMVKESKVFSVTVTDTVSGCKSSDEIRVEYDAICVSINEDLKESTSISYFPNPTNGMLMLKLEGLQVQNIELLVLDMTGAEVFSTVIEIHDLNQEAPIDLSELESGNYLIRMRTNSGAVVHKITKY